MLLGGSNAKKWNDYQKKKFFINNSVADLSSFKEEHQVLLKLRETFWNLLKACLTFGGGLEMKKKWGEATKGRGSIVKCGEAPLEAALGL